MVMQLVDAGAVLTARDGCNCLAADIAAQVCIGMLCVLSP